MSDSKYHNKLTPGYYTELKIEPLTFIQANGLGFCEGNVVKYICRYKNKNGVEDLKKAREYIQRLIDFIEINKEQQSPGATHNVR